jgi:hypothetical protein
VRALTGLGQARFALAEYPAALAAFRRAHELDPSNEVTSGRLALCEGILALDPTAGGLRTRERHRRSLALVEQTLAAADSCLAVPAAASNDDSLATLAGTARARLHARRRPPSLADATEDNVRLAEDLWRLSRARCPAAGPDDSLGLLLARLSRTTQQAGP